MKRASMILAAAILAALVTQIPALTGAQGSADVKADYDRSNSLNQRVTNTPIHDVAEPPVWITGSQKFWYRKSVKGGNQFVLVDPAGPSKGPAFDHARLATSLGTAASQTYTATTLPFTTFTFADNMQAIDFAIGGGVERPASYNTPA